MSPRRATRRHLVVAILAVEFFFGGRYAGAAQPAPPDAATQESLRQQDRERQLRSRQEQIPDVRLPRPSPTRVPGTLPSKEVPCFPISRIVLTGDAADRFQFALRSVIEGDDSAIGRCLGAQGINAILTRVQNAIVAAGFVTTRVLAAPQDIKSGELVLTVIPGRVRDVRFDPHSSPRGTRWNALPASAGDVLNLRDLEQGLENFKRVPTADADIQITPSEAENARPGESDLIIRYGQAFPLRLTLAADDAGSKATGKYQGSVTLSCDNCLTLNDLFYVSLNHDLGGGDDGERGTRGSVVHYSLPYKYWLLGFTASEYRYHQAVAGANQTYIYSGTSDDAEVKLSRVVYRDATRRTTASLRGYFKTSNNFIDDTEVEVQRRRMAGWEAALTHRQFLRAATFDLNLAYRHGTGAFGALPAPEDAFGEGTARPEIVTLDLGLSVPFQFAHHRFRYAGAWRGQWNGTRLIPQDRFAIGGRYTVRGFDGENVLSAERGWFIRNDLGVSLGDSNTELYLGVDYGEVAGPASDFLAGRRLAGAVLGWRGGFKGFQFDVFAGQPVSKPDGLQTAHTTAGFNLSRSF